MSQTIENRIVEMQFENKQFESGVQESLSTIDKLKKSLKFDDAGKNLQDFGKNINKNIDLSGISNSIDSLKDKFSISGIAGMEAIRKLTDFAIEAGKTIASALDAPFAIIRQKGWSRAMNIEDAKFQLKGLGIAWESVSDDINYAVADTAFGLDEAAKACSQLSASSVRAGDDMKAALRGISGVAAMGNTEYSNIANIFTKAAGNGKVMADELNRISQYGLNARATMKDFFNDIIEGGEKTKDIPETVKKRVKTITKGVKVAESDISEFASKSKIDFQTFSYAMDSAFGEHAKAANETFQGSLANIKAALGKIGAEFFTPVIKGAIPVFNEIRIFLNDLRKQMTPVFETFKRIAEIVSENLTSKLKAFRTALLGENGFGKPMQNLMTAFENIKVAIIRIVAAVKTAINEVFPGTRDLSKSLVSVTEGIAKFTEKLILSDSSLIVFKNILVLVFSALKNIGSIISFILPIIQKVASVILTIVGVIIKLLGYLGSLIFNLDIVQNIMDDIRKSGNIFTYVVEKLKNAFTSLRDILTDTSTLTGKVFTTISNVAKGLVILVGVSLYAAFMKIREIFSYFDTHDPLGSLVKGVQTLISKLKELPVIKTIVSGIEIAFGAIGKTVLKLVELVKEFITNIRSGMSVVNAIGVTLSSVLGGAIGLFGRLKDAISSCFSIFQKDRVIEEKVEMPIYGATKAMVGMEHTLTKTNGEVKKTATTFDKAKSSISSFASGILDKIKNIKTGQVLLAAFSIAVTILTVNLSKLADSFTGLTKGITGVTRGLANFLNNFGKKHSSFAESMLAISIGIATLAGSLWAMSQIPTDRLTQVTICLGSLLTVIGLFSVIGKAAGTSGGAFAASMAAFSGGILMLVAALWSIDQVNMENIWTKMGVLGLIVSAMLGCSIILSKVAPAFSKGGLAIVAFAGSVYILAKALDVISHANLDNIQKNWIGLTAVIVAFGIFAATASNVGIAAALGLIGFVATLKIISSNSELLTKYSGTIQKAFFTCLDNLKTAVKYLYESCKTVADDIKKNETLAKVIQNGIIGIVGSITVIILALGRAGKGLKKAATGFMLVAASIAGLMFVTYKIAQLSQSVNPNSMNRAIAMLSELLVFIGLLATLATVISRSKVASKENTTMLRDTRKVINSMSILMLSVGAFCAMVGSLTEDEFNRTQKALIATEVLIGIIAILCTKIATTASQAGKADVSFGTFAGIVLLIGSLVGTISVLMYMFSTVDFEKDKQQLIAVIIAFVSIVTSIGVIIGLIARLKKNEKNIKKAGKVGVILSLAALVGTIAASLILIYKYIPDLKKAGIIAGILSLSLVNITGIIIALEAVSSKVLNTKIRQKAFNKTLVAIGEMIVAIGALALTFYALSKAEVNPGTMALQALIITSVLATMSSIVMALQKLSKDKNFSITKSDARKFEQTVAVIGMFVASFAALGLLLYAMKNVDAGRMAGQATTITLVLASLTAIVVSIEKVMKKADTKNILKVEGLIAAMTGLFTAIALISKYIIAAIPGDAATLLAKAETVTLLLAELGLLVSACGMLGKYIGVKDLAIGEAALLAMIGIFAVLTLVFRLIDDLRTEGILAKSQSIILCLTELGALAAGCGMLWQYAGGMKIFGGEVALIAMVGIFAVLAQVFKVINNLKTEGILAKSQAIMLCLVELGVIGGLLGAVFKWELLGVVGSVGLWDMLGAFAVLVQIFEVIDGLKTEGIMAKSQTIVLVMTELVLLAPLMFADIAGVVGFLGLYAMLGGFAILAQIFKVIDGLKTEGILAKSQTIVLVMLELEILAVLMLFDVVGLVGFTGLYAMIGAFGALAAIFTIIDGLKTEGIMKKSQTIVLVMLELEILAVIMALDVFGNIGASGLMEMITAFGALTAIFTIIDGLKTEGILAKSQTIVLVMLELEILAALMSIDVVGSLGSSALLAMVAAFGQIAIIFTIIDTIKTEGVLQKSQTIVLVLLELELLGSLMFIDTLGSLGASAFSSMVAAFSQIAIVFKILDTIKTEGILVKSQEIVLVLLELEILAGVLGVLAPLALAAQAGTGAIIDMCNAMILIATAIAMLNTIPLDQTQGSVDMLVQALWMLIPIGMAGTLGGPGLVVLAMGIETLGLACGAAGSELGIFAEAATSIVSSIERLVMTGPGIAAWCASVSLGITTLCNSVTNAISKTTVTVVTAVDHLITGVVSSISKGTVMIFQASSKVGEMISKGIRNSLTDIAKIPMDIIKALVSGITGTSGEAEKAGNSLGAKLVQGFRNATGWHSPPDFIIDFLGDAASTFLSEGGDVSSICDKLGGDWGSSLLNGLGSIDWSSAGFGKVLELVNGLKSGEGDLMSEIMRLMGMMDQLTAYKNKISSSWAKGTGTMSDYEYQLQTSISSSNRKIKEYNETLKRGVINSKEGREEKARLKAEIDKETESVKKNTTALNQLLGQETAATDASKDFADSLGDIGSGGGKAAKGAKEAKDAIADFYDSIESAISLFDKFEEEEGMSSDELLSNMQSQITGIANWSTQLQTLATKGIDQGLLKKLADMGPSGQKYVKAFVNMTNEQLVQANDLYQKSLLLPQHVTAQVYASFEVAGANATRGYVDGLDHDAIKAQGVQFAHDFLDNFRAAMGIHSPSEETKKDGMNTTRGYSEGIMWPTVIHNLKITLGRLRNTILDYFDQYLDEDTFIDYGKSIVQGLKKGIEDAGITSSLFNSVRSLCNKVVDTAKSKSALWINSPSHKFQAIGSSVVEGLAKGITDNTSMAMGAMNKTSTDLIDEMRDAINKANETLIDDIDDPVIKPVLDLSDIESGSTELNNMLSRNEAINASASFSNLQNGQWNSQQALLNATMDNTDVVGAIASLSNDILDLKETMTNIRMVLDTGTMVGAMTPMIDKQLGVRKIYAGRGI